MSGLLKKALKTRDAATIDKATKQQKVSILHIITFYCATHNCMAV